MHFTAGPPLLGRLAGPGEGNEVIGGRGCEGGPKALVGSQREGWGNVFLERQWGGVGMDVILERVRPGSSTYWL